ncbi:hypothetical protein PUN28_000783 [Cardiocondyla obscurior]|uniref:Secreted protein n=1 Tax=Cardiocondyla obscurior TaxID=286306 RepID=A0AAW2H103_9HYME
MARVKAGTWAVFHVIIPFENLCDSNIWVKVPLFHTEFHERTTARVGIFELMRHWLVESTESTSRENREKKKRERSRSMCIRS